VYRSKVVLVQRCEMRAALSVDMQRTSAELRERVARINATFGDVIDYEEAPSYSPTYRIGLFHRADVLLQVRCSWGQLAIAWT
jgi:trehalose-6-phosphate synthase